MDVRRQADRTISTQLQLASRNFKPVEYFLDRISETLRHEFGPSTALQRRGGMQPTALNTFEVRYSIPHPDAPLWLTFIVTGEDAETILIQGRQRSTEPGQLDQRVYRLDRLNDLKEALRARIIGHFTCQLPEQGH